MCVVFKPFLRSDYTVALTASDRIVVLLKGLKEFSEHLVLRTLARLYIWVH